MRERTLKMVQEIDEQELERAFLLSLKIMLGLILVVPLIYLAFTFDLLTFFGMYAAIAATAGIVWLGSRNIK